MKPYHKIPTILKRDPATNHRTLLPNEFATSELEYLSKQIWIPTEKVDGTNIRVDWDGEKVRFGGKTDRAQLPADLLEALYGMFPINLCKRVFTGPITLYGEGYGPKIQKIGSRYCDKPSLILFDAWSGMWLEGPTFELLAHNLGIDFVPVLMPMSLNQALSWAAKGGQTSLVAQDDTLIMEGLVLRPQVELLDRQGHRIITKIKVKDFKR